MEISGLSIFYLGCLVVVAYAFYYCWQTSTVERETQELLTSTVRGIRQTNQAKHTRTNTAKDSTVTP
jgi:hypothetical protein